jgi:hypothetical protein
MGNFVVTEIRVESRFQGKNRILISLEEKEVGLVER